MEWMLDIQLGRRNLTPIQRIAVAEKYRPIYEERAKKNQGTRNDLISNFTPQMAESNNSSSRTENETNTKLAKIADVGKETYRRAKRILDLDDEELKQEVLSGRFLSPISFLLMEIIRS